MRLRFVVRLRLSRFATCAALVVSLLSAARAAGQFHRVTDPVATPASTVVLQDDAATIDVNPATLGFVRTWSLQYRHAQVDEPGSWLGQGDALSVSTPLLLGLSFGATVQSVRPGPLAAHPAGDTAPDRAMLGLAFAFAPSKRFSLGVSGRGFYAHDAQIDGLFSYDVGLAWHAVDWLGFSLTGRDLLATRRGFGTSALDLRSSLIAGWQIRPFGNSDLVLDFAVGFNGGNRAAGRFGLGVRVPYLGYAAGLIEAEHVGRSDRVYRVMAELTASFERMTLGGGVIFGQEYGGGVGAYALARFEGRAREGVIARPRVLDVELGAVDEREMVRTLLTLEAAVRDERVAGVLLRPRGAALGSAYAQELRLAIAALRAAGKRVACHLEDASGSQYYACAAADAVLIDPAGSIRLLGASTEVLLFGQTLRNIGLHADFIRIGDYKSAPEQYTQEKLSEPGREELAALFTDVHARVLQDLSGDLHVDQARIANIMDNGPHLANQALADKLVVRAVDESAVRQGEDAAFDGQRAVSELPARVRRDWYAGPRVGVVVLDGSLVDGNSVDIPLLGVHMTGGRTAVAAIDAMRADPLVRAIVLRVDSPGGAVLASDQMWRAVRRARAVKPVVVSMGAVAASGGYYVASAGDEIWADPSTITGSIGIFFGKVDVAELASKLGVGVEFFRIGKRAGGESLFRPFTPDERAALGDRLRTYYRLFLRRVAEGRGLSVERVDALGQGRIYSGDAALRVGLIDHLGGFASALMRARQLGHVSDDAEIVVLPRRPEGLLDYVFGALSGASATSEHTAAWLPAPIRAALARAATLQQLGAATPLALLPYDVGM
jgi:protease-4